ncbi:MAG: hypothetical protein P8076_07900 [Gammaproteobacteria bacterium]
MTRHRWIICSLALVAVAGLQAVRGDPSERRMRVDNERVRVWNQFARDCLTLHKRLLQQHEVRETTRIGGYDRNPKFYKEISYYDRASGKLLSRIQWEREHPDRLHSIEVYVRDAGGRVQRDFAAAYLPAYRNAPVQTLINLHGYNGQLHGFRQFDASGEPTYEYCEGSYHGKPVQIRLFEDDLYGSDPATEALMASPQYKACFEGVPAAPGKYLTPQ